MAGGAPLPVREFTDYHDMLRRYAEVRATTWLPREVTPKAPLFRSQELAAIPAPDRDATLKAVAAKRAAYLADQSGERLEKMKILQVARIVAAVTGVSLEEIKGDRHIARLVKARHIAFYLACRTGRTQVSVGHYLGGRDHTTVLNGRRRAQAIAHRLKIHRCSDAVEIAQRLWDEPWDVEVSS